MINLNFTKIISFTIAAFFSIFIRTCSASSYTRTRDNSGHTITKVIDRKAEKNEANNFVDRIHRFDNRKMKKTTKTIYNPRRGRSLNEISYLDSLILGSLIQNMNEVKETQGLEKLQSAVKGKAQKILEKPSTKIIPKHNITEIIKESDFQKEIQTKNLLSQNQNYIKQEEELKNINIRIVGTTILLFSANAKEKKARERLLILRGGHQKYVEDSKTLNSPGLKNKPDEKTKSSLFLLFNKYFLAVIQENQPAIIKSIIFVLTLACIYAIYNLLTPKNIENLNSIIEEIKTTEQEEVTNIVKKAQESAKAARDKIAALNARKIEVREQMRVMEITREIKLEVEQLKTKHSSDSTVKKTERLKPPKK